MNLLPFENLNRKILTKQDTTSNPDYGKSPQNRSVEELIHYGIINLNKPEGPTSHQITDYVKKILKIKKAGHSGTLDPKVTGCLPIAFEDATKIVQTLLTAGKEYICLMHIHEKRNKNEIVKAINEFVGTITQLPPIRSAVKRRNRERTIYYIDILDIEGQNVLFKVGCQAGTYIRKLCHDMGLKLNTHAHMAQLIRTKAGPFKDKNWHTMQELTDAYEFYKEGNEEELKKIILPIETATEHLAKIWITDSTVDPICHGAELHIPGIAKLHENIKRNKTVAIMTLKNELIALGISKLNSKEILTKKQGSAVATKKVFMKRDTYPKYKKDENNSHN
jgi:H/ACA ribonucleoprotein complex subunit 4